jgi:hypothetical protein
MPTEEEVSALKRRHSAWFLSQPEVSGIGVEQDEKGNFVLAVHLNTAEAKARERLPDSLEGHRVKYIASGPFRKLGG